MSKLYLLKLGEISLKGLNRRVFEKTLSQNIKNKLRPFHSIITSKKGRMYLQTEDDVDFSIVKNALSTTFGLEGFAPCYVCAKDISEIKKTAQDVIKNGVFKDNGTFKVAVKREDKNFSLSSYELSCELAGVVNKVFPSLKVDLKNPDFVLYAEIRANAYLYVTNFKSPGGLPIGTAGKALSLLSGGIDSPVSSVKMASRGLREELVYFHAYPFTGDEALEKVKTLASLIAPYLGGTILHVVNFTPMQMRIKDSVNEKDKTIMLRAAMMRVAKKLALKRRCTALVTGEALSQVASQTLSAMSFTTSMADFLVLRPLVGMNKEEIINIARQIGTYETSILPFADCCSLFSPKHPVTNPNKDEEKENYKNMDAELLEDEAVESAKVFCYDANGREKLEPEI